MAKGQKYTMHLDDTLKKGIYGTQVPDISFLYKTPSTTKETEWNVGDCVELPDGRSFVYAKSAGNAAMYNAQGCVFTYTGLVSYTAFAVSKSIGDTEITIPAATHAALTEDELRGGWVIIFDGASNYYTCTRQIMGNDACDANVAFDVQLDAPLAYAITAATSAVEVYRNHYNAMDVGTSRNQVKAGLPTTYVPSGEYYFWVQTKGICWPAPQGNLGDDGGWSSGWWHDVGNVSDAATALGVTIPAAKSSQYAGFCVQGGLDNNGPLFNLADHRA